MIPKIIHLVWLTDPDNENSSNLPTFEGFDNCYNSLKKYMPDFEIKIWTNEHLDFWKDNQFFDIFWRTKNYAYCSDYVRLWALYEYGGLYFDTDVELYAPINQKILDLNIYLGLEWKPNNWCFPHENPLTNLIIHGDYYHLSNAIIGCCPNSYYIEQFINGLNNITSFNWGNMPTHQMMIFLKQFTNMCVVDSVDEAIFCKDRNIVPIFNAPFYDKKHEDKNTDYSFAHHHWIGTWYDCCDRKYTPLNTI